MRSKCSIPQQQIRTTPRTWQSTALEASNSFSQYRTSTTRRPSLATVGGSVHDYRLYLDIHVHMFPFVGYFGGFPLSGSAQQWVIDVEAPAAYEGKHANVYSYYVVPRWRVPEFCGDHAWQGRNQFIR